MNMNNSRPKSNRERLAGPRFLIVNGDDFGLTDGVIQGIVTAWKEGVLTSTTALINIEGAPERINLAHRAYPGLPIGLHLNITQGRPVLPPAQVPSLVNKQGCFYGLMDLIDRLHLVSLDELRLECFAQAELLLRSGVQFDHIDCHQGIAAGYEPFAPVVIELARRYQVPVRNPVLATPIHIKGNDLKWAAVREMVRFAARRPRLAMRLLPHITEPAFKRTASKLGAAGIPTTNWLVDAFYGNARVESMVAIIEQLPPGVSEVACHPGLMDAELRQAGDGYVEARSAEVDVLVDPRVKEALERCQVRLVNFSFLTAR